MKESWGSSIDNLLSEQFFQIFPELHLNINPSKTYSMFFATEQKRRVLEQSGTKTPSICIGEESIDSWQLYLGRWLDSDLHRNAHINKLAAVLSKNNIVS